MIKWHAWPTGDVVIAFDHVLFSTAAVAHAL